MSPPALLTDPAAMRAWSVARRRTGQRIGLVPTMGALHGGHLALIAEARGHCDAVVVSIFVNPLQFDRGDDFDRYPRPLDDDLAGCAAAGVDAVYAPTSAAMYPAGFETRVVPGALASRLEGAARPGHFEGVATVVTKLLAAVHPDVAWFGEKDFQQLAVVRRMVTDLDLGVEIEGLPTIREPDGLAMSSRNRRLSPAQRAAAVCVPRSLQAVQDAVERGERNSERLLALASGIVGAEPLARLEYVTIVEASSLEPLDTVDRAARALTAVWFGDVRLIDNIGLEAGAG